MNDKNHTARAENKEKKGNSIERVWYTASRESSDTLPDSQPCTQTHGIYISVFSGRRRLGRSPWVASNQRGSETSQACYSRSRCNLNLVHRFLFLHPRGHKPAAHFAYCAIPDPRVKCGGTPDPRDARRQRSSATPSVHSFPCPSGSRFPAFSSSPDTTLLAPIRSSAPDRNNFLERTVLSMLSYSVRLRASL